jgi:hypothetical protein
MVLALGLALASAVTTSVPVHAESYPTGERGAFNGAATFWGNTSVGGKIGLCLDPGTHPPSVLDNSAAAKVCGAYDGGQPDKTAQLAYLLAAHVNSTDDPTLASISQFARGIYHSGVPVTHRSRYDELVAEAKDQAGPKQAYAQVDAEAPKVWIGLVRAGEADKIANPDTAFDRDNSHHTIACA